MCSRPHIYGIDLCIWEVPDPVISSCDFSIKQTSKEMRILICTSREISRNVKKGWLKNYLKILAIYLKVIIYE